MKSPSTSWPSPVVTLTPPGLDFVWVGGKLEIYGPTGSHKDRECALILAAAIQRGHSVLGCSSTGNLARALAVACRNAALGCELWLGSDADPACVEELREMGAHVYLVDGGYAASVRVGNAAMAERRVFNGNPSQCAEKISANQVLGEEILDETRATRIACATNNGSLALGLLRAARKAPHNVEVVAVTCPKSQRALSVTGAHGLEEEWRRERDAPDCCVLEVDDAEIKTCEAWLEAQKLPVQPAAAATLAALPKLDLTDRDRVICVLSGLRIGATPPILRRNREAMIGEREPKLQDIYLGLAEETNPR
jgi:threonine dehydratase